MSGTNSYIFQQHRDILRELKKEKICKFKTCVSSSSSSSSSSGSSSSSSCSSSGSGSEEVVAVTVEISSGLILSYEIRFVSLGQDITNNFANEQA